MQYHDVLIESGQLFIAWWLNYLTMHDLPFSDSNKQEQKRWNICMN